MSHTAINTLRPVASFSPSKTILKFEERCYQIFNGRRRASACHRASSLCPLFDGIACKLNLPLAEVYKRNRVFWVINTQSTPRDQIQCAELRGAGWNYSAGRDTRTPALHSPLVNIPSNSTKITTKQTRTRESRKLLLLIKCIQSEGRERGRTVGDVQKSQHKRLLQFIKSVRWTKYKRLAIQ